MKNQQGRTWFVLVGIVVLLGVVAVAVPFFSKTKEIPNYSQDNSVSTVDWKLYKNGTYGFEFKYPSVLREPVMQAGGDISECSVEGVFYSDAELKNHRGDNAVQEYINVCVVKSNFISPAGVSGLVAYANKKEGVRYGSGLPVIYLSGNIPAVSQNMLHVLLKSGEVVAIEIPGKLFGYNTLQGIKDSFKVF